MIVYVHIPCRDSMSVLTKCDTSIIVLVSDRIDGAIVGGNAARNGEVESMKAEKKTGTSSMNAEKGRILIVDDDTDILHAARLFLKQQVGLVHTEADPEKIPSLLRNESYDVILLDMNFTRDVTSGQEGFHWLKRILEIDPQAVVVLITAYGDVDIAIRAIKEGATDFILKPWQNEKLWATVSGCGSGN
jgi:PleD family two-component response regulator